MSAKRYRKKPVEIEAIRFLGDNATDCIDWILAGDGTARYHDPSDGLGSLRQIAIDTLEGTMRADAGDWIIRGVKGEYYPCKPDIFEATYQPVESSHD
jgi:hypothetical protein